ncbi:MAG: hypothetical protein CVV42_07110 [Candidatus Riflebacteria bacterium HGW-Riflebacteria-2]|jgi:hypothetical protein|nr:MAG: hypothetical protein CVV42_07110 [Candidatus Riflebacteria bacterium HGW-Riflebacteria-2]
MQNVANLISEDKFLDFFERKTDMPFVCLKTFDDGDPFVSNDYLEEKTHDRLNQPILTTGRQDEVSEPHIVSVKSDRQTSLHGCVLSIFNEDTVKCLLQINEMQHETILPIQLFVVAGIEIEEGVAFTAELKIVDDFKSLVLSSCPPQQNQESKQEIYDLLARL